MEGEKKNGKTVYVTAYPNIAPAGRAITRAGHGSSLSIAIGRAVDEILKDDRVKGKKILLPMRLVVTYLLTLVLLSSFACRNSRPTPNPALTPTPIETPTAVSTAPSPRPCKVNGQVASDPGAVISPEGDATIEGDCELKTQIVVGRSRTLTFGAATLRPSVSSIPILMQDGGTVKGAGWESIVYESTAEGQFQVIAAYRSAQRNGDADSDITIRDLQIKGANAGFNSAPQTISLGNCSRCTVDRVWLNTTRTIGIQLGGASFYGNLAEDSRITNCLLTDVASQGLAVVNGRNITLEGNRIVGLGQPGGPGATAIDLEPNGDDVVENVVIRNNYVDGLDSPSKGNGILVQIGGGRRVANVLVEGNEVHNTINALYVFGANVRDVTLRNNRVRRTAQSGVRLEGADIVCVDNQFTDVGGGGTPGGFLALSGNSKFEGNTFAYSGTGPADNRLIVIGNFQPGNNPGFAVVRE